MQPQGREVCENNMRPLEKKLRWHICKDHLWLMKGRSRNLLRKSNIKEDPKYCFYRVFFGESLYLQARGYDTNSGTVVEFTPRRQLLLMPMWKSISLIKGRVEKIKQKEFAILYLSSHIYFIHIYAWNCNAKMECVIIPDEAYSKYRLSKMYGNLHFESA